MITMGNCSDFILRTGFPDDSEVKNLPANAGDVEVIWSLDQDDPLEEGMATHSSILAQEIPWIEEPGELQSMGSQKIGHDWVTNTFRELNPTCCHQDLVQPNK